MPKLVFLRYLLSGCAITVLLVTTAVGCASAPVVRTGVTPALVCPGDVVTVRIETEGHSQGRLTSMPTPVSGGSVLYAHADGPFVDDHRAQICETTTFHVAFWNGDETSCGTDYTTCSDPVASVAFDDVPVRRAIPTCGEAAAFTLDASEFGSFVVREIINCTEMRTVELTLPDGTTELVPAGGSSSTSAGMPLVGTYRARRNIIPPEGCPPPGETRPGLVPPAPPAICLVFVAGCAPSDSCG
jgi:hypothetical protein